MSGWQAGRQFKLNTSLPPIAVRYILCDRFVGNLLAICCDCAVVTAHTSRETDSHMYGHDWLAHHVCVSDLLSVCLHVFGKRFFHSFRKINCHNLINTRLLSALLVWTVFAFTFAFVKDLLLPSDHVKVYVPSMANAQCWDISSKCNQDANLKKINNLLVREIIYKCNYTCHGFKVQDISPRLGLQIPGKVME